MGWIFGRKINIFRHHSIYHLPWSPMLILLCFFIGVCFFGQKIYSIPFLSQFRDYTHSNSTHLSPHSALVCFHMYYCSSNVSDPLYIQNILQIWWWLSSSLCYRPKGPPQKALQNSIAATFRHLASNASPFTSKHSPANFGPVNDGRKRWTPPAVLFMSWTTLKPTRQQSWSCPSYTGYNDFRGNSGYISQLTRLHVGIELTN